MMTARTLFLPALLGLMACGGEPFVSGDYRGEPMFTIRGDITLAKTSEGPDFGSQFVSFENIKLAIYWIGDARAQVLERQATTRSEFPSGYQMKLFAPPTRELYSEVSGVSEQIAVGFLIAYIDQNQDDTWDSSEQLVGSNSEIAIVYNPKESVPGTQAFDFGYNIARAGSCQALEEDPGSELLVRQGVETRIPITLSAQAPEFLVDLDCDGQSEDPCAPYLQRNEERQVALNVCVQDQELTNPTKSRCWPFYERYTSFRESVLRGTPTPDLMVCYPPDKGPYDMQLCHQEFFATSFCPEPIDARHCERDLCLARERDGIECTAEIINAYRACEAAP